MPRLLDLFLYSLIPGLAMTLAGLWATFHPPNKKWRSALMHFAAGVIFAVVAVELLPDLVHEHSVLATVIGFALGTAAMLVVRALSESTKGESASRGKGGWQSFIVATSVDLTVDGLMLGVGFATGIKQGTLLTIALAFELVTLGLAVSLDLRQNKLSLRIIPWIVAALAVVFILTSVLGSKVLSLISGASLVGIIAFGAAALLFLVTEELLTEAHKVSENSWLTASFFVGFLSIFLLDLK